jgi:hypothetical protein
MLEGIHKPAVPVYEMQDAADLDLSTCFSWGEDTIVP